MSADTTVRLRDYNNRLHEFVLVGRVLRWYFTHPDARRPASAPPDVSFYAAAFRASARELGKGRSSAQGGVYRLRRSNYHMGIPHPLYGDTTFWFRDEDWVVLDQLLGRLSAAVRKVVSV